MKSWIKLLSKCGPCRDSFNENNHTYLRRHLLEDACTQKQAHVMSLLIGSSMAKKRGGSNKKKTGGARKAYSANAEKNSINQLNKQLAVHSLEIRDVVGDGNCLFRALSDQMVGDCSKHESYRNQVCAYIVSHRDDFEPFFDECENFEEAVRQLRRSGTFAGNEALVAFSRSKSVSIVIHQAGQSPWRIENNKMDTIMDTFPLASLSSTINEEVSCEATESAILVSSIDDAEQGSSADVEANAGETDAAVKTELHICYHAYEHYSSVRKIDDNSKQQPASIPYNQLHNTDCVVVQRNRRQHQKKKAKKRTVVSEQVDVDTMANRLMAVSI